MSISDFTPRVSVVIPFKNEERNIEILISEIETALQDISFEIVAVNDGSTDATASVLKKLQREKSLLQIVTHRTSGGQSAAIRSGVTISQAPIIATLDGDGQNNPSFLPQMIALLEHGGQHIGLVQGERQSRKDAGFKRWQSRIANKVRQSILHDETSDTGCGLKVFWKSAYFQLPYFDALHRFMPALIRRDGYEIRTFPVIDRPRHSGRSNYGFFDRLWVGILDLFGVWWLIKRRRPMPEQVR